MNKIFNINLGGYPFVIDEDAFQYLQKYLSKIKKQFNNADGYDEIISDIECRLAELIEERLDARQIVGMNVVKEITDIMGEPDSFVDEDDVEMGHASTNKNKSETNMGGIGDYARTRGRRLFRDPEDKVIGGVCSGLSAYLGLRDPLWLRIAFVILFFTGGISVLLYLVLLIVVPKAKTSADRLAMQGEPINIDNIAKTVEEEFENLSGRFSEVKDEFGFGKKKRHNGHRKKRRW